MALSAKEELLIDFKGNLDQLGFRAYAYGFCFSKSLKWKEFLISKKLSLFESLELFQLAKLNLLKFYFSIEDHVHKLAGFSKLEDYFIGIEFDDMKLNKNQHRIAEFKLRKGRTSVDELEAFYQFTKTSFILK